MPSLKPWLILILRLEGGPDDGETRLMPATVDALPPERLEPSLNALGAYVRHPEIVGPWTWRYLWVPSGYSEPKTSASMTGS